MFTPQQNLEYPIWKGLAKAIISRGAMDYIMSMRMINGEDIPKTNMNRDILVKPDEVRSDCEDFFFSSWFRILAMDSGLDGMAMATMIEQDWEDMYCRMKYVTSGRIPFGYSGDEAERKARERERRRRRYHEKKLERMKV